jgi:hypothetical protein
LVVVVVHIREAVSAEPGIWRFIWVLRDGETVRSEALLIVKIYGLHVDKLRLGGLRFDLDGSF